MDEAAFEVQKQRVLDAWERWRAPLGLDRWLASARAPAPKAEPFCACEHRREVHGTGGCMTFGCGCKWTVTDRLPAIDLCTGCLHTLSQHLGDGSCEVETCPCTGVRMEATG